MQKRIAKQKTKRLMLTTALVVVFAMVTSASMAESPYPPSSVIKSITWYWDTHATAAPGSDLWPVTWASDGNIYTAWGDGGGFNGTNSDGRVSMGFARIEGAPESYVGINVNGGKNSENPASFPQKGKTGGILSVDGTLYARLNLQDGEWPDVNFGFIWSEDLGTTWTEASWVFPKGTGNFKPSRFLNFGRDYTGVPTHLAGFVYFYGFRQDPDSGSGKSTYMGRVPRGKMKDRSAYEFFKGLDADGEPIWTSDVKEIQPVFTDPNGACLGGVVYNPGIKRYILISYHTGPGQLGIFDASEPWGPWTTVAYYDSWGNMGAAGFGLNCDFPQKWMGTDGLTMWCVFSVYGDGAKKGISGHDKFNLVKTTLMHLSNEDYGETNGDNDRIQIYKENPRYWQYKGKPVLLLGGSKDDNLFQWIGSRLTEHLDLLKSVGGNYVRCTMSSRDEGNVWPFKQVKGKYNLEQWDEEYWQKFESFLKATCKRDIIVQVEIWATYDFYREPWQRHPLNPKNNINYTTEQTGLSERVDHRPGHSENVFFQSVPAVRNQKTVLKYQRRFVDKMLSHSLKFGHVLYCMDNETAATPQWGKYWSEYVKTKAKEAGVDVQTTEMWYDHLDKDPPIPHATFDDPETYSFVDVSQNSHKRGQRHWDSLRLQLSRVDDNVRPLTNVKIYGADTGPERWFRADVDGVERFWRNIFGGMASVRFHRPPAGLGLGKKAQANIESLRMLTNQMDIFTCTARNDLLSDRKSDEAYCLANPGKEYAVYFPDGGEVVLDIGLLKEPATIRWLEISTSKWGKQQTLKSAQSVTLRPPESASAWVALLVRRGVAADRPAGDVTFTRTKLTTVAETNMGHVPMADINGDGVIDIVAGLQWFEGPSWKRHPLYPPDTKPTAIDIGFTVPYDLDGDGDLDLMTHRRSSDDRNKNELFWFENPGSPSTGVWTKQHITWDTRWPEVIIFVDIDGDDRDEMICSDVCPGIGIRIYEIPHDPKNASSWSWTAVDKSPLHGLGIGDLNEDGRLDIVSDFVWFEQDARGGWIRHSLPSPGSARRGHETMQIKVYDVDADGDVDLILPRAHHYGAYWLESSGGKKPVFKLHEILPGKLPSQLHGVAYGDIDGDGDLDIFAGKSRYRHGDPGNDEPLDVFWIELVRSSSRVRWVKHQLATDLTMGIGPTIADVDADGDMDLVLRGHGIGGRYVIGTRQTNLTLFIREGSASER